MQALTGTTPTPELSEQTACLGLWLSETTVYEQRPPMEISSFTPWNGSAPRAPGVKPTAYPTPTVCTTGYILDWTDSAFILTLLVRCPVSIQLQSTALHECMINTGTTTAFHWKCLMYNWTRSIASVSLVRKRPGRFAYPSIHTNCAFSRQTASKSSRTPSMLWRWRAVSGMTLSSTQTSPLVTTGFAWNWTVTNGAPLTCRGAMTLFSIQIAKRASTKAVHTRRATKPFCDTKVHQ